MELVAKGFTSEQLLNRYIRVYINLLNYTRLGKSRQLSTSVGCVRVITQHMQLEHGKVIGPGVHIYVGKLVDKKNFESYFSDRLTLSNIRGRTSRRIYRPALPLHTLETLSLSSK